MSEALIKKYNVPGPRYTSYPSVPFWHNHPTASDWKQSVQRAFGATNSSEGISLYLHLPFCESLCTYCGCNKRITKNHAVEQPYIEALLAEWEIYKRWLGSTPVIREIHIGGGTPTFFSPQNLGQLFERLLDGCDFHPEKAMSFEAHPNNTSTAHMEVLYNLGFDRLSLGIQDFDPKVQRIVNRIQSFAQVQEVVEAARSIGYDSINFDLIYGLPLQTPDSIRETVSLVHELRPERIAFYSYAHVPWKSPGQRMFTEADLPSDAAKRALYDLGKNMLEASGYIEIGMDHFALPDDELTIAARKGRLHRNFMGYTTGQTQLLIGLGASAISDSFDVFVQNEKKIEAYMAGVHEGHLPIVNGHKLDATDLRLRRHIQQLMTNFNTVWQDDQNTPFALEEGSAVLEELERDGLVRSQAGSIVVTELGRPYVRNICMALDPYLRAIKDHEPMFSKTV